MVESGVKHHNPNPRITTSDYPSGMWHIIWSLDMDFCLYNEIYLIIFFFVGFSLCVHITTNVVSSNPVQVRCTPNNISLSMTSGRFSPGTPVSSTNKTDRLDITEILLKVALNIKNHIPAYIFMLHIYY